MSKMDELYNDMYKHCEENGCWKTWMTATEWCDSMGKEYGPASFTSLVKAGRLERDKDYRAKSYSYHIVPTEKIEEMIKQIERNKEKESAEYVIAHYEEEVARVRALYEEKIEEAQEWLDRNLERKLANLRKAKQTLEDTNN